MPFVSTQPVLACLAFSRRCRQHRCRSLFKCTLVCSSRGSATFTYLSRLLVYYVIYDRGRPFTHGLYLPYVSLTIVVRLCFRS